jgi:hypothetical protein
VRREIFFVSASVKELVAVSKEWLGRSFSGFRSVSV